MRGKHVAMLKHRLATPINIVSMAMIVALYFCLVKMALISTVQALLCCFLPLAALSQPESCGPGKFIKMQQLILSDILFVAISRGAIVTGVVITAVVVLMVVIITVATIVGLLIWRYKDNISMRLFKSRSLSSFSHPTSCSTCTSPSSSDASETNQAQKKKGS